jgi:formyltetrahydrofolate-dependent phosphoribosylglycinamide formyltransferase
MTRTLRLAVLLSGSGRTLANLIERRAAGELDVEIPVVISSRSTVAGVEIARSAGIETHVVTRRMAPDSASLSARVKAIVEPHGVDLFVLAGFLRQLEILPEWLGRIINIHPSLLPLFGGRGMYGHHVHEAVLASGMKVSGCSVHIVTEEYDSGPIVAQRCVPIEPGDTPDTLAARVFAAECELYPEVIRLFAAGRVDVRDDRVEILSA